MASRWNDGEDLDLFRCVTCGAFAASHKQEDGPHQGQLGVRFFGCFHFLCAGCAGPSLAVDASCPLCGQPDAISKNRKKAGHVQDVVAWRWALLEDYSGGRVPCDFCAPVDEAEDGTSPPAVAWCGQCSASGLGGSLCTTCSSQHSKTRAYARHQVRQASTDTINAIPPPPTFVMSCDAPLCSGCLSSTDDPTNGDMHAGHDVVQPTSFSDVVRRLLSQSESLLLSQHPDLLSAVQTSHSKAQTSIPAWLSASPAELRARRPSWKGIIAVLEEPMDVDDSDSCVVRPDADGCDAAAPSSTPLAELNAAVLSLDRAGRYFRLAITAFSSAEEACWLVHASRRQTRQLRCHGTHTCTVPRIQGPRARVWIGFRLDSILRVSK